MKKVVKAALFLPFLLSACNDNTDIQEWFPAEYHKILYILESGEQNVTLYNTGEDNVYTFTVCKAGSDPTLASSARIGVVSQADIDAAYTANEGIPYKVIPTETYSFEPAELAFAASETSKKVNVRINPEKMKAVMENATEANTRWLLPLVAVSEEDSVNVEKNSYTLRINEVMTPPVGFVKAGVENVNHDYNSGPFATSVSFGLLTVTNNWDVEATIEVDKAYVAEYNNAHGTNYRLPAEGTYTVTPSVTLTPGVQNVPVEIAISDFGGEKAGRIMLPIRIKSVSMFEVPSTSELYVLALKLVGKKFNRAGWTAEGCTEEAEGEGSTGRANDVLDDNVWTYWHTNWMYGCNHPGEKHYIIIDSQKERTFTQVGVGQRRDGTWGYCVQDYNVYISSDKQNWTLAGQCYGGWGDDELIDDIATPTKGRYVKLEFLNSRRDDGQINAAEFWFYGEE